MRLAVRPGDADSETHNGNHSQQGERRLLGDIGHLLHLPRGGADGPRRIVDLRCKSANGSAHLTDDVVCSIIVHTRP